MSTGRGINGDQTPDELIAGEVRAEMGRRKVTQAELARAVFGNTQQWVQVRTRLHDPVPFTGWELVLVANYLRVDVVKFLDAAKQRAAASSETAAAAVEAAGKLLLT